ncbi:hypothetical protein ABT169_01015, partial [Streptomyces sp. NPDC001616]|uniref:hypothetical protein n=1 Tax=Streptomyces sp. NPDC001616 TaxID=3156648 RepID=UPI003329ABCA
MREGEVAGVLSGGGIRSPLHEGFVRFLRERCPVVALDRPQPRLLPVRTRLAGSQLRVRGVAWGAK